MGLHKLTAGDGYTYLTRQVAVHDATERGHAGLGDYYSREGRVTGTLVGLRPGGARPPAGQPGQRAADAEPVRRRSPSRRRTARGRRARCWGEPDRGEEGVAARTPVRRLPGQRPRARAGDAPDGSPTTTSGTGCTGRHPYPRRSEPGSAPRWPTSCSRGEHGRAPLDDRERAGFLAQASRQQTTAVAGYDLTFTPVKSVSTLWALARARHCRPGGGAHDAAVAAHVGLAGTPRRCSPAAARAGFSRCNTRGLIAARFTHRDARSGDPNLHTHVAVSNKVQDADRATGSRWTGGRCYKANVTLSETVQHPASRPSSRARLGVRFAPRAGSTGRRRREPKRAVREIVGRRPAARLDAWSRRSTAIEARRRELAVDVPGRARPAADRRWSRSRWPSRRTWRPGRPSTSPAPRPTSARRGVARPSRAGVSRPPSTRWWVRCSAGQVQHSAGHVATGWRPPLSRLIRTVEIAPGDLADLARARRGPPPGPRGRHPPRPPWTKQSSVSSRSPSTRIAWPSPTPTR